MESFPKTHSSVTDGEFRFAVSGKEYVSIGFAQYRMKELLKDLPENGWMRMSAGDGSKGLRFYDWLLIELNPPEHEGWSRGLLVRRRVGEPQEIKAHVVYAPSTTRISEMVRVAGIRWSIEVSFEDAQVLIFRNSLTSEYIRRRIDTSNEMK